MEEHLGDAEVSSSRVQTDGNIITSQGPGTAMEFALEIIRTVKGEAAADEIRKELLMIYDVTTSCGCTEVAYSKEPTRPGTSVSLNVTYRAEHPERFDKSITVYCNATSSPLQLRVKGEAE